MNYAEKLQLIKKELIDEGSIDGYENQLGFGNFNKEKFEKALTIFKEVAEEIKNDDPYLSEILGWYTNFAVDTACLLTDQKHDDLSEIIRKLENLF